jgi:hypothetical protein
MPVPSQLEALKTPGVLVVVSGISYKLRRIPTARDYNTGGKVLPAE